MDQSASAGTALRTQNGASAHRVGPGMPFMFWEMSPAEEEYFPGEPRPMPDRVTYRFANGWVDTGDLPCREALHAMLGTRPVVKPRGPFSAVYWGSDGEDVDFSVFRHRPTLIRRGLRCRITPRSEGQLRLRVATCGGVNIWLGDTHVAAFEPFTRNTPQTAEVAFDVPSGTSELTLRLEDLHERDTMCFLSLTHVSGPDLDVSLSDGVDLAAVADAARVLSGLRTEKVYAEQGTIRLIADEEAKTPITFDVLDPLPFPRGGITEDPAEARDAVSVTFGPESGAADLFEVASTPAGCLSLDISTDVQGARLSRRLGFTNLPEPRRISGSLADRKAGAANVMSDYAAFDPSVAALLAIRGQSPERVTRIVEATLTTIEDRYDCSDFSILPMLRLWRDARDTLPPALRDRMRHAFLNYRYWYDAPGNDVMWFWSENHVLCFHTAQMIAGGLFPDETFTTHGMTGRQMQEVAGARLTRWFDAIDEDGLCEWNSAAYYPIDFLGLFSLHDMEPELRGRARAVLDGIFVMIGLHTTGGVPAGTQGRAYEKELLAGPVTELGSVAAVAFGGVYWPGYDRAAALFCLSDYVPPEGAADLATPQADQTLTARYTQGFGHAGKLTLWKSAGVQLSTVTGLKTGQRGHQAHVIDVQFASHPMARLWINHPGELKVWGERRPSLLAGNHVMPAVAQHEATALMIYDVERDWTTLPLTQLFAPPDAFDSISPAAGWTLFRAGKGCAAVWCSDRLSPVVGLYKGALHRLQSKRSGWIVALAYPDETDTDFRARLARSEPVFEAGDLTLEVTDRAGRRLSLGFDDDFRVNGVPRPFLPLSTMPHLGPDADNLQPWDHRT